MKDTELKKNHTFIVMAEDPGAVNFIEPLLYELTEWGYNVVILAAGFASDELKRKGFAIKSPPKSYEMVDFIVSSGCRLLIVGTSENQNTKAFDLIVTCRSLGIQSVGIVDSPINAELRFSGNTNTPLSYCPDWLIVPDKLTAGLFEQLGVKAKKIKIVGNPAREFARNYGKTIYADMSKQGTSQGEFAHRVVFVSELSTGLNPSQYKYSPKYTLEGRGKSKDRTCIVAEEILDAKSFIELNYGLHIHLILRLHPKETEGDLGAICNEFDEISSGNNPLNAVSSANLVIGMTSMLLLQAYDMGLPCLSVLPCKEEVFWVPEIKSGDICSVINREMLRKTMHRMLTMPQNSSPSHIERRTTFNRSTSNMGHVILSILGE